MIVRVDGQRKGLSSRGELLPDPREGRVAARFPNGLQLVHRGEKYALIDAHGARVTKRKIDEFYDTKSEAPIPVRIGQKWTFVMPDGRFMHDPPIYDGVVYGFDEGIAIVRQGDGVMLIDETGQLILDWPQGTLMRYVKKSSFVGILLRRNSKKYPGLFRATRNGTDIVIDHFGVKHPEPPDEVEWLEAIPAGQGLAIKDRDGYWGIQDTETGAFVIEPIYRAVIAYQDGVAWVPVDSRRQWFPVDTSGKIREGTPPPRVSHYPIWASNSRPETLHPDPYENSVLWTTQWLEALAGRRPDEPQLVRESGR